MTQIQSFVRRWFRVVCSMGLLAITVGHAAEPVPAAATTAQTGADKSDKTETTAGSDTSKASGSGVSERLRHKNRAVTAGASTTVSASGQAPGGSRPVQHQETDLNFIREPATTKTVPQHTPEWTDSNIPDPGRSEPAGKGDTADSDTGAGRKQGEKPAAGGDGKNNP